MCLDQVDNDFAAASFSAPPRRLRVAIAGLGVVGEGAALELSALNSPFDFCGALVRDRFKPRGDFLEAEKVHDTLDGLFQARPDIVIDALPDGEAGYTLILSSLMQGISIVSANKQALAGRLEALHGLAQRCKADLRYSAAVGGGSPMIETVRKAREAGRIRSVTAILNGTVNFILTEVAAGKPFAEAITEAQRKGFAEPDPTADLSGEDARAKLSILAYGAFGREIDPASIEVEALTAAKAAAFAFKGGVWKQLAQLKTENGGVSARVRFERVDADAFFRNVNHEGNALRAITDGGNEFTCSGAGAGRIPTVASIFFDLAKINAASLTPPTGLG